MTSAKDKPLKPLVLTMKGKWYDMILSGEKQEEYREFKPYWIKRISNWLEANRLPARPLGEHTVEEHGYSKGARRFVGWCDKFTIGVGARHPEWGEGEYDGKTHFVLHICKVEEVKS